jgi:hypothetical protein
MSIWNDIYVDRTSGDNYALFIVTDIFELLLRTAHRYSYEASLQ